MQQIDHHPVLTDQAVLDPPEIEASHGDFLAERRDAQPAVMADGLDHVRPAGHGGVIIVTEEVIGDLGDLATSIGHAVQERDLVPSAEALDAASGADAGRPVPVHPRMPEARHLHHLGPALARMAFHMVQHVNDQLLAGRAARRIARLANKTVT